MSEKKTFPENKTKLIRLLMVSIWVEMEETEEKLEEEEEKKNR